MSILYIIKNQPHYKDHLFYNILFTPPKLPKTTFYTL